MKAFADVTAKYISQPWRKYPCMRLVYHVYRDLDIDVPDNFEDLTIYNYLSKFRVDPYGVQIQMLKCVRSLGKPSTPATPKLADLLVVSQDLTKGRCIKPGFLSAIYVGRNSAVASFLRCGVMQFELDKYNRAIVARTMI